MILGSEMQFSQSSAEKKKTKIRSPKLSIECYKAKRLHLQTTIIIFSKICIFCKIYAKFAKVL